MEDFYELGKDEKWRDITDQVLASRHTSKTVKILISITKGELSSSNILATIFWIKGFISYTPDPNHHPLLVLYRWEMASLH